MTHVEIPPFISLDGIDGAGKSTQIERLREYLTGRGCDVLVVRDPGSTDVGKKLREILLDSDLDMHRRTEALLFMASRCELVETVIRPALAAGRTVVSDRFLLANVVYQSVGGVVTADALWQMGRWSTAGLQPDLTLLLDMPAASAVKRINGPADRMERRGVAYLETVRQAFLSQLPQASPRIAVIDADRDPDQVAQDIASRLGGAVDIGA